MHFTNSWHHNHDYLNEKPEIISNIYNQQQLWTRDFIRMAILNLFLFMTMHMLVATFPFYITELGGNSFVVGMTLTLFSLTSLIMRPLCGWYLDNISRKNIFYFGIFGVILFPILYIAIPVLPFVIFARCLHGFVWSGASTSSNTNVCDIIPKSRFGEGIGFFGLTYSISMALAPAFGLYIMEEWGFRPLFFTVSIIGVLCFILLLPIKLKKIERHKHGKVSAPLSSRLAKLFNRDAVPAAVMAFISSIPYAGTASFVALYAVADGLGSGGLYFTIQAIFAALVRVVSGRISDRRGEAIPLYVGNAANFIALFLLLVIHNPILFYLSALFNGIAIGLTMPAMQTMSLRVVPTEQRGAASSTYLCAFDIGMAVGGIVTGMLVTWFGYRIMFGLMMIPIAAEFLVYYFWASRTKSAFRVAMNQSVFMR